MGKLYTGIRQRSAGSFEIRYRPARGSKTISQNIKANSKHEAYLKRVELMAEALKTTAPSGLDYREGMARDEMTFESIWPALERYIVADGLTHRTLVGLKRVYNRLFVDFRLMKYPHILTPAHLTLPFFLEYKSYYSIDLNMPNGVRSELVRVKIIMGKLRKLRYCSEDLIRDLRELKVPKKRKKAYPEITFANIKALFLCIKKDRPDLYGPLYFMLRTGRRVEETTLIERADVIWDDKLNPVKLNIRAETTKMKRSAPLSYLDGDLQAHIRAYYQSSIKHKPSYLFLNRKDIKCTINALTEYLGNLSQEMLGVRITCHYLRHRFCTETMKAKLPIIDILEISGIKDITTLIENYSHSSAEGQASVLERTRL